MIVVADTSPLKYLVRLQKADVLAEIYGRVIAPAGVLLELQNPRVPGLLGKWATAPPPWIEVVYAHRIDPTLTIR